MRVGSKSSGGFWGLELLRQSGVCEQMWANNNLSGPLPSFATSVKFIYKGNAM